MSLRRTLALLVLALSLPAANLFAQPLGTFRWQLQPFCNVITVNVTQQGGIYTLDGTDDRCGGGNQAGSAVGVAYLTPLGLVGFGISTVLPNGTPVHTEATINISSLSGTWRDSAGNNGDFVFTPGAPIPGSPRPIPTGGLAPASITNIHIANNAITTENIVDGSITAADILDAPRAEFVGDDQIFALTLAAQTVRSVTITAPAAGRVIVNASGYFWFVSNATADTGRCTITTGTTLDSAHHILGAETSATALTFQPFAGTRGFSVAAGTHTFNLVCDGFSGTVAVGDSHLTATYVPNAPTP